MFNFLKATVILIAMSLTFLSGMIFVISSDFTNFSVFQKYITKNNSDLYSSVTSCVSNNAGKDLLQHNISKKNIVTLSELATLNKKKTKNKSKIDNIKKDSLDYKILQKKIMILSEFIAINQKKEQNKSKIALNQNNKINEQTYSISQKR